MSSSARTRGTPSSCSPHTTSKSPSAPAISSMSTRRRRRSLPCTGRGSASASSRTRACPSSPTPGIPCAAICGRRGCPIPCSPGRTRRSRRSFSRRWMPPASPLWAFCPTRRANAAAFWNASKTPERRSSFTVPRRTSTATLRRCSKCSASGTPAPSARSPNSTRKRRPSRSPKGLRAKSGGSMCSSSKGRAAKAP